MTRKLNSPAISARREAGNVEDKIKQKQNKNTLELYKIKPEINCLISNNVLFIGLFAC